MPFYSLRKATIEDHPHLLRCEEGIIEAERPYDSTLKEGEIHYYDLIELIKSEDAEVLVVCYEDEIVASGYAKIKEAMPYLKHQKYAYLGFMFVEKNHRGKGLNGMIIDGLKYWAKEKGLNEIRLEVYAENTTAVKAYEKAGFTANLLEMRVEI